MPINLPFVDEEDFPRLMQQRLLLPVRYGQVDLHKTCTHLLL